MPFLLKTQLRPVCWFKLVSGPLSMLFTSKKCWSTCIVFLVKLEAGWHQHSMNQEWECIICTAVSLAEGTHRICSSAVESEAWWETCPACCRWGSLCTLDWRIFSASCPYRHTCPIQIKCHIHNFYCNNTFISDLNLI